MNAIIYLFKDDIEFAGNMIVYEKANSAERREAFKKLASVAKANGAQIFMQINHVDCDLHIYDINGYVVDRRQRATIDSTASDIGI